MTHYGEKLSANFGLELTKGLVKKTSLNESVDVTNKFRAKVIAEGLLANVLGRVNKIQGTNSFEYDREPPPKALSGNNQLQGIRPRRKDNILSPYEDPDSSLNQQQNNVIRRMNRNFAKGEDRRVYEQLEFIALSNKQAEITIAEDTILVTPLMARNIIKLHEALNPKNKKILKTKLCESSKSFYESLDFAVKKV